MIACASGGNGVKRRVLLMAHLSWEESIVPLLRREVPSQSRFASLAEARHRLDIRRTEDNNTHFPCSFASQPPAVWATDGASTRVVRILR